MKKNIFKYILVPAMILCAFGINFFKAQNWTTVWTESFNGLPHSSSYNNGVTGYWNNSANPPQNSQISGTFEATPANGIVAGTTQVPSDASGGRFLMFWTQSGVTVPASENVFFKKTITVVPGKTYRINYRFAILGAVPATNRANATFKVSPQGSTTPFYTSTTVDADANLWKVLQYEFKVPANVTSIDLTWENTSKATAGNDFALDDLVLQEAVDSDGDGIPDSIDQDDDNDGILDSNECTSASANMIDYRNNADNFPAIIRPPGIGFITGNDSTQGTGITRTREATNNYQIISQVNAVNEADAINLNEYVEYKVNIGAKHILVDNIGYYATSNNTNTYTFTLRVSADNFVTSALVHAPRNYTSTGADFNIPTTQPLYLNPNTTYTFRVYFYNVAGGASQTIGHDDFKLFGFVECDTDNDGIPNRLDLDSDADGCSDAIEGGANINATQLVTASGTVSGGSTTVTQNLCAGTGCVNAATGIPQFAILPSGYSNATGQSVGDSQNNLVNGCYCYKLPEKVAGNPNPVKHGITALNRAESDNSQWPQARQSAWTVLESKTKGFVVNRLTASEIAAIPTANLVEGMMVYDKDAHCLKIYNGTIWSCFNTQTCPD